MDLRNHVLYSHVPSIASNLRVILRCRLHLQDRLTLGPTVRKRKEEGALSVPCS